VHGSISDGIFHGRIVTSKDTYFVENAKYYFPDTSQNDIGFHSVIYKDKHVNDPYREQLFIQMDVDLQKKSHNGWTVFKIHMMTMNRLKLKSFQLTTTNRKMRQQNHLYMSMSNRTKSLTLMRVHSKDTQRKQIKDQKEQQQQQDFMRETLALSTYKLIH
jgi:hypothetical protein